MSNVLIVSEAKNFIASSLVQHIQGYEHKAYTIDANFIDVENLNISFDVMIIVLENSLLRKKETLILLKDKVIAQGGIIYLIGSSEDMNKAEEILTKELVCYKFVRPVNVKEVCTALEEYMDKNSNIEKKKILVVDDSGAVLRNVKGWLEDKYKVILANSGAMAIKYLAMNRPDLILLDYEMPICDGKQVLEMIRSEVDFANIPVIFLTNKNDKQSVMEVTNLKPEGYLLKTMEPAQIIQTIDDFFAKMKY